MMANGFTGTIGEYDATTGAPINPALISGPPSPFGLALSGGNLFVSQIGNNTIGEHTTSGATVNPALVSGLVIPEGIVVVSGSVPDSGTTMILLGTALSGLTLLRRFVHP